MSANKSRRKSDEPDLSTLRASRDSTTDYSLEASISVGGRLHQRHAVCWLACIVRDMHVCCHASRLLNSKILTLHFGRGPICSPTRSISSVDATPRGDIDASTFTTTSSQSRSPFDILASLAASELRSEDGGQASERGHNVSATATPRGVASASVTPRGVNEPFPRLHASPARRSVTMTIGSLSNVRFGTVFDNETGLVMIPVNPSSSADMEIDGVVS
jgi:hypothetical protein